MGNANTELYNISEDGQIPSTKASRRGKEISESVVASLPFQIALLIICAMADFAGFYQMFSLTMYDSIYSRILAIIGMLIGFEILPILCANAMKKINQGLPVKKWLPVFYSFGFLEAVTLNLYLRYTTRDIVFPNIDNLSTSNPNALPFSIFFGILPVITSLVSFGCAYGLFGSLKSKRIPLEEEREKIMDEINQLTSTLAEYETLLPLWNLCTVLDETDDPAIADSERQHTNHRDEVIRHVYNSMANRTACQIRLDHLKNELEDVDQQIAVLKTNKKLGGHYNG
jgi:hypothetical protein